MPEHILREGREIISKLVDLGKLLNYHCETEHEVDLDIHSAVDVAWLSERGQRYPLFIFEIESSTTNSIIANPSKVFAEPNQKFEKPLFFFHVLLKGGQDSAKINQLQNLFGQHNYRVYRLSMVGEEQRLLTDVLSQHRRLTDELDISEFLLEVADSWPNSRLEGLSVHIENAQFLRGAGAVLPAYARVAQSNSSFRTYFIDYLRREIGRQGHNYEAHDYGTQLGSEWDVPVHLGLLSAFGNDGNERYYFEELRYWQERSSYMDQIGPFFGLSQDYDYFILGVSGAVLGLLTCLFHKVPDARIYFSKILYNIIDKSDRYDSDIVQFNALWLLHMAPNTPEGEILFEFARDFVNSSGGIPEKIFKEPLVNYTEFLEDRSALDKFGPRIDIPPHEIFLVGKNYVQLEVDQLFNLAIDYLTSEIYEWNVIRANQL